MERPPIYCFAKSLDLTVIKLTRRENNATIDLLDFREEFFCNLKSDFNSHSFSVTIFL